MTASLVSTLAQRVREERLRLGWTQGDMAGRCGMCLRSYQHFEQSARITLPWLERVLAALGLSLAVVPADGAALLPPAVTRTRQRGLRHAPSGTQAAARPSQPGSPRSRRSSTD